MARGRGRVGPVVVALEGVLVAPGFGVDVDLVAVLGEAVDESADAGGAGEDGAPLLEGEVGGEGVDPILSTPSTA
jgi:hypothetical protein